MSAEMLKQKTVAGKVFSFFGPGWEIGSEFIAYMEANSSDEIIHYYIFPKANEDVEKVTYAHYTIGLYANGTTLTTKNKDPERFFEFYELMNTEEGWIKSRGFVNYDFTGENTFEATEGYEWVVMNDKPPIRDGRKLFVASQWMGEMWGRDENWWWNRGLENFGDFTYGEVNHPLGQYDIVGDQDVGMWWEPQRVRVYEQYGLTGTNWAQLMRDVSVDRSAVEDLVLTPETEAAIASVNIGEYLNTQLPRIIVANSADEFEALWEEMKVRLEEYGKSAYVADKNALYNERLEQWNMD